ncbi:Signal transduction histidine kinase [Bradyrhizobium erythrophlei]|uniref:histidine kinase n=2 Tax=Bradyrhizobium erythrophlei TaxID=1437360 RepID=A0A1M7TRA1_9BRAD|nr:Signal transduction histidine kinase [Bradyrhizobium erythrophlei]
MSPQRLDQLRAEQVAGFYRNSTPGTAGGMIVAPILSGLLVYEKAISFGVAAIFVLLLASSTVGRLALIRSYKKAEPPAKDWRRWANFAIVTALIGGSCWGLGGLFLMDPGRPEYQFMVLMTCAALAAGAITAFGTYLPSYYCNLFTIMAPGCVWSALQGDALHWTYAILDVIWVVVVAVLANSFSKLLIDSLELQFANLDLANDLLVQKEFAEAANVAKSRFLASASHDLRQPVHALGMFVGALRDRPLDEVSGRLVRQIQNSIGTLDSLFSAILDISRLDAGVIESGPQAFAIHPMLERICRDEIPEIDRKGIELRLVHCSLFVRTDPVLLERVLRNLVSNAVRYTDAGRVVVGCRRGARLSVQVWDSGRGIPADQQDLIFQEFYQIGNSERDRAQGLGLGLAIVRRLTRILDIPMQMQSRVARGSVFKLSIPVAAERSVAIEPSQGLPAVAQASRFILVIDDEVEIQEGMKALLTGWGHSVVTASSCAEMLEYATAFITTPSLIISDYRLRNGEDGILAIERLRSEFNSDIPAILITGDTTPDRIRDAVISDCFLMHKPVSDNRLRASIAKLTAEVPGRL